MTEEQLDAIYWDFDARRKGLAPYNVPYGQECAAFKAAFRAAQEKTDENSSIPGK